MAAVVATLLAVAAPAGAVVGGEIDGTRHPNVAMILFVTPDGRFRCSATLVSPTVLITAGHCTDATVGKTIVSFAPVAPAPGPAPTAAEGGYHLDPDENIPDGYVTGTAFPHPEWDGELQLNDLHDVGVVVLDEPVTGIAPATLVGENELEALQGRGTLQRTLFEVVGYGVFFDKPEEGPQRPVAISDLTRRFTTSPGQNLTSQVLKLQENPNDPRGGGGTCFGDSGGPVFLNGELIAVTSFGASIFCHGMGGYYRLDIEDARDFLDDFVTLP
jgi:hypothetical protein